MVPAFPQDEAVRGYFTRRPSVSHPMPPRPMPEAVEAALDAHAEVMAATAAHSVSDADTREERMP